MGPAAATPRNAVPAPPLQPAQRPEAVRFAAPAIEAEIIEAEEVEQAEEVAEADEVAEEVEEAHIAPPVAEPAGLRASTSDPLAPLMALSAEEKIALFT
jgi:hypothetical protein